MRRCVAALGLLAILLLGPATPAFASHPWAPAPSPSAASGGPQGATTPTPAEQGEALRAECQIAAEQGDLPAAVDACERAVAAFRREGNRQGECAVQLGLGWLHEQLQDYEDARSCYTEALSLCRETGDSSHEAQAGGGLCRVSYSLGDAEGVSAACPKAAQLSHDLDLPGDEATALYVLGLALQKRATDFQDAAARAEAEDAYSRARALYQVAGDRVGEAGVLQGIGDLYTLAGDNKRALEYYLQALPIHEEIGNNSLTMVTLSAVASAYGSLSDSQNALSYYRRALPLRRETGDRAGEASTLSGMGLAQKRLGDYPAALASYTEALAIWKELGNLSWQALLAGSMGDIYSVQFDNASAKASYEEALAFYRQLQDRANEALTLHALGGVYFDMADYAGALDLYKEALSIRRDLGDRLGESRTLNNMALVYDSLSQYQEALRLYEDSLEIKREIGDEGGQAAVLGNIAAIYAVLYENRRAQATYNQALEMARQAGDRRGEMAALTGLGTVLRQDGRAAEAIEYHSQALSMAREISDRRAEAAALGNLGVAYDELGQDDRALESHRQALTIRQELGDVVGEATSLTLLGELSLEGADYPSAESYLLKGLQTWQSTGDRRSEATALGDLAILSEQEGQDGRAVEYALQAISVLESIYSTIKTEDLQSVFANGVNGYYQFAVRLLVSQGREEEAFMLAERGRARAFLNLVGNQAVDAKGSEDSALVRRESELRAQMNAVERVLHGDARPDDERALLTTGDAASELQSLRQQYTELLPELQLTNPEYASMVSVDPLALDDVQAMLRDKAPDLTLLSYFVGAEQTLIFVVTTGEFHVVRSQVAEADLRLAVEALLAEMKQSPLVPGAWQLRAEALYAWLVAPIAQYLPSVGGGAAPRVGIVPYGPLHYLPFGLLHSSGTGSADEASLLQDRFALFYAPSVSSLRFLLAEPHVQATRMLSMANPDAPGAPHLAHAVQEAELVASLYGTTALAGVQATEGRFKQESAGAGIIHLAAHSDMQPAAPLFSAILLQPDGADDGRLETHEILNLELSAADLVVLSACQTHVGELSAGDDMVGLERAFFRAGTPSLVTTLWPVDDRATAALMDAFYTRLRDGVPKAEALRQAQQEARKAFPEPYYWAGFVLVGDPGAASSPQPAIGWWLWALAAAGALGLSILVVCLVSRLWRRRRLVSS